jgi:RimJ/RimL family protein N-acetyltransferase
MIAFETPRLLLRSWRDADREPLAAMSADPEVMEHFPSTMSREESDAMFERLQAHEAKHGITFWAVETRDTQDFAGMIGLGVPRFTAPFTPCVEIGWRIARPFWNRGYATEGARAALEFGFKKLALDEILAFTVPANLRSRRVMDKLGMRYSEDFEHPSMAEGHPQRTHVLYRLKRQDWAATSGSA